MSANDNFYLKRRSVLARKMASDPINDEDLKIILDELDLKNKKIGIEYEA